LTGNSIKLNEQSGIATVFLEQLPANAMDISFLEKIDDKLKEVSQRPGVRAMVLTGQGTVFSAGLDLKKVPRYNRADQNRMLELLNQVFHRLYALPIPTVAAINGHAIAGGLILALACDRRIAVNEGALFGLTEVRVSVPYPVAAMVIAGSELSPAAARELVLAGRNHDPARALMLGIVDELRPAGLLLERSQAVAQELAAAPTEGYRKIKRQLRHDALSQIALALAGDEPLQNNWLLAETAESATAPVCGRRETFSMRQFFLEGVMDGSLVQWFVLRTTDGTLQWFDEELAQEMFRSDVAMKMYSYLKVKEANAPLPSVPAEPPAYRATLEGGAVVVCYLVNRKAD
jgi:enoyl-CoA hydratase